MGSTNPGVAEICVYECQVCERHFRASDIRTSSSYVDSKTGKVVEAKLKIARLSPDAVPCVFPNCPAYLSAPATATSREAPDEKRMRLEAASLREAIAASLQTYEEEESGNNIDTFQTLLERVSEIKLSSFWNVISRPTCVVFFGLASVDTPSIFLSITISQDLTVKVYCRDVQLTTTDGIDTIPVKINDMRLLTRLLDDVEALDHKILPKEEERIKRILTLTLSLLQDASNCELSNVEQLNAVRFLKEQVALLLVKHCNSLRYSPELLTDCLEERFGKYRQLAGAQYHISIRQVYESERKLRLQNILELPEMETATAAVAVNDDVLDKFDIEVADDDYQKKAPNLHATTYVAGYCAHAAFKKLSCMSCKGNLMLEDNIEVEGGELVQAMTRGGLKFPQPAITNAVLTAEIVLDKLRSEQYATQFHALPNQKEALLALTHDLIIDSIDFDRRLFGHVGPDFSSSMWLELQSF
ncbi:hypothetical protein HPB49_000218 [Dermacentor silvarum]|uniref:Uncharacterized protein n=1 Tax=Dermacentor silvarum TaxID=543639 RepID=A0ACB8DLG0_DERSI|nr:hypothetical protein HPB49_000218 [Dermacentor silvarum]